MRIFSQFPLQTLKVSTSFFFRQPPSANVRTWTAAARVSGPGTGLNININFNFIEFNGILMEFDGLKYQTYGFQSEDTMDNRW